MLYLIAKKWGKQTFIIGIFVGLVFLLGDRISVMAFKDVFQRLRPCHNPEIANFVHLVDGCGGKFGFVSSHASNSFAFALFIGLLFRKHYRLMLPIMIFWAALVSYSRIYVGVHYPGDILCGGILGTVIGIFVYWLMKACNKRFNLNLKC